MHITRFIVIVILAANIGLAFAQQDPIPPPSTNDDPIVIAIQVAKVAPQAFSLSRAQNNQFDRVVQALRKGSIGRADRIWLSLIQDIYMKGGPLPNFEAMTYTVVREAVLEDQEGLTQPADAYRFASERLRILREALTLVEVRIRKTTDVNEANKLEMERQRLELMADIAEQDIEEAKRNYKAALEQFRQTWRIMQEQFERLIQATVKFTG